MAYDGTPGSTLVQADTPNPTQSAALPVNQQPAAPPEQPVVAQGAQGRPPQAVATAQSEPTPQINKPPFDPRPYAWVAQHNPQLKATIDDAAQATGVDPARIAWHAWKESGFKQDGDDGKPVRGSSGEIGMMQLMPGTVHQLDPTGRSDPYDIRDNAFLGGKYIAQQDARFGQNSPSSFAAYNGGPGGVKGEKAQQYAVSAFPGTQVGQKDFLGEGSMTPHGLVHAGTQGGPDAFLRYAVDTAPAGMPVSDVWRHAEALLVGAFAEKGDLAGAQHAKDWVFQMSHTGSNQYLMAAHQALSMGDGVGASQYLAKAHAFFPDGTIGRFRTDGKQVYAERLDENDPSHRIGGSTMVTPNDIAGLLNQTSDPHQFLATLAAQQKSAAETRLADQHGQYYAGLNPQREAAVQTRAAAQVEAANVGADAKVESANVRADNAIAVADMKAQNSNAGAAQAAALSRSADKETSNTYNPVMIPKEDGESDSAHQARLGDMGEIHRDARMMGSSPPQAERFARGLSDHTLQMIRMTDGSYGVINAGDKKGQPIGYISKALGDRLAGAAAPNVQQGQASPIGAGANSPYAMGAGVSNNLSGTVNPQQQPPVSQSSALPVGAK
jgi:hypothetical protein